MEKKQVEVIIGKMPTGPVDPSKSQMGLKWRPQPPAGVGGREMIYELVQDPNCSGWNWIWYDTDAYHSYTCCHCWNVFVV